MSRRRRQSSASWDRPSIRGTRRRRAGKAGGPRVSLCQHEDLVVAPARAACTSRTSRAGPCRRWTISRRPRRRPRSLSRSPPSPTPGTSRRCTAPSATSPARYPFAPDREDYLVHITTGTHVAQICTFLLDRVAALPGRLLQTSPPRRGNGAGTFTIIDLDLSRYDSLASRFQKERTEGLLIPQVRHRHQNAAYNRLIERIEQVAVGSRAPILLLGPTGAGKSQLARRIFELKKARRQVSRRARRGQLRHPPRATGRCPRCSGT